MNDVELKENKNIPELEAEKNILGKWAGFFITRYRIVYLIIIGILVWGISSYLQMPRELEPEIVLPFGQVVTIYNGAGPEEVEKLITDKIEKELDELDKVKSISSTSGFGYSSIFVEFEPDVDIDDMIAKMREKVSSVQGELPDDAETPEVTSFETNNSPIMIINVSGNYDFISLKTYAEKIKDELDKMKEISDVQIIGGLEREIKIIVDPQKLAVYNLSLEQIKNVVKLANINFPGGNITLDNKNYNIRTVGELKEAQELEKVVISYIGSSPLYLRDIAQVIDGYKEPESYSRMGYGLTTDNPAIKQSVAISVKKKEWADVVKTSKKIHKLLKAEKGIIYPDELQIEVSGDTAVYVEDELGTVIDNSKSGLFLVLIVLFLFIGFKESLVVSFVIPLSIFTAFGFMDAMGMTFNNITLFSLILAVGMLVDNGIVIMENIDRLRFLGLSSKKAAEVGTNQIAPAIGASTLTTLAAFFPIMLTSGIMGEYIKSIPLTVIFALSASYLVAITITPTVCAFALKNHRSNGKKIKSEIREKLTKVFSVGFVFVLAMLAFRNETEGIMGFGALSFIFGILFALGMVVKLYKKRQPGRSSWIVDNYSKFLKCIIKSKKRRIYVISLTLGAFILSLLLIPLGILKIEMFPPTDYTRLYVNLETPKGTSLEDTSKIAEEVEKRLLAFPEIKTFVSNVGITGADSLEGFGSASKGTSNIGRIIIDLYEKEERQKTSMEIAAEIREKLQDIPGVDIEVQELQSGPPSGKPILIEIRGENLEELKTIANDFTDRLKAIDGARDVSSSVEEGTPELQIKIKKDKAALLGLDNMTIAMGIRNTVHGLEATTFKNNQDEIDVVIRTNKEKLSSIKDLEKINFYSHSGQSIAFSQVAEIVESESMTSIKHEDLTRRVNITSDVITGVTAGEVTKKFQEAIKDYPLPKGVSLNYGGEFEDIQESYTDMFTNMIIAVILVFLILAIQFNSLSQPLIILMTVPMSMIGVMPGLVLTGNNFGFVSFIGVVALVGIAVNNGILLVDYINYLRKNNYELYGAVEKTGRTRFLPVMTTTITTAGGILPITIKQPFFSPMGYALIFGLLVSTMLTLIVIPVLYTLLEEFKIKKNMEKGNGPTKEGRVNEEVFHPISIN